ncbi:MAG TPA: Hsp20/alpha crystallin family protein [Anaerolineales bacterium]|nr:Hsp20/alpha crystallin family protein [Anaerolineales bacterium]
MTFYLQTYPYNHIQRRHGRRMAHGWNENHQHALGVNIREEDEAYILSALVPGLKAEDLNIQVLDDVVRIEGEYKLDENQYLMQELPHGSFTRTLRLPAAIDADSVDAKIADGVLTLTLPKTESAKPKKIQIKSK